MGVDVQVVEDQVAAPGQADGEGEQQRSPPAEQPEHDGTRHRRQQDKADRVRLVVVVVPPVDELEEQVDVREEARTDRDPDAPGIAQVRLVPRSEYVDRESGEAVGDRGRNRSSLPARAP
jgi:hypothetical protein